MAEKARAKLKALVNIDQMANYYGGG